MSTPISSTQSKRALAQDKLDQMMEWAARRAVAKQIKLGVSTYRREKVLPSLMIDPTLPTSDIIARLQNALRAAKNGLRSGHWTADHSRVLTIRIALRAELGYGRT